MNCPGCGAAMQVAGNRRHFRCHHCGGFHFPEETGDGIATLGEASPLACPVCHVPLERALLEGEHVRYCQQCRGFVTPMDAFGRIVHKRRALHGPHEQATDPFDPAELRRMLHCPSCAGRMEAHPYFGGGNAVVDTCERCHWIWLDAGELAIIERYLPHVPFFDPIAPISDDAIPDGVM